uniref:Uncharacterized protein n=1 Tax=Daucus carota subsp. sativus TaxID=79200 RepID=A0A165ZYM7_DAUCS
MASSVEKKEQVVSMELPAPSGWIKKVFLNKKCVFCLDFGLLN